MTNEAERLFHTWASQPTLDRDYAELCRRVAGSGDHLGPREIDQLVQAMFFAGATAAVDHELRAMRRLWRLWGPLVAIAVVIFAAMDVISVIKGEYDWSFGWYDLAWFVITGVILRGPFVAGVKAGRQRMSQGHTENAA